ncbi:PilW family protein [Sedimenticola hydrogenitrophicus]|uniref:PilW family protein n=1 Tax=Sedimenticola hydrogenitrophicus TaxID=2967975 RepID=UPI0023B1AE5C|nr:PilW family protein [Sedimenticola hydrogenitrophicus]
MHKSKDSQSGLSLIELMIAMLLALILTAAIIQVFSQMNNGFVELMKSSRQLENGRYAMTIVNEDLRHAGFYGEAYELPSLPLAAPNPCSTSLSNLEDALPVPVQAFDDSEVLPVAWDCFSNRKAGTDILIIRRAATATIDRGDLDTDPGNAYLQTRGSSLKFAESAADDATNETNFDLVKKDGTTPANIRKYIVHAYYIASCRDCGAGDGIPTLRRLELSGVDAAMQNVVLVDGIEDFQLDIGLDTSGDGDLDEQDTSTHEWAVLPIATNYTNAKNQWENTIAVGINLISRNLKLSAGYTDSKTYRQGQAQGASYDPSGSDAKFKRHAFNSVTRVINTGSRREGGT